MDDEHIPELEGVLWTEDAELKLTPYAGDRGIYGVYGFFDTRPVAEVMACLAKIDKGYNHLFELNIVLLPQGIPIYIGKGVNDRPDSHNDSKNYAHRFVRYLKEHGKYLVWDWLQEPIMTEVEALKLEGDLTRHWKLLDKGGILLNYREGGNEGFTVGPEARLKQGVSIRRAFTKPEVQERHRTAVIKALSKPEARIKMRAASRASHADPKIKEKHRAGLRAAIAKRTEEEKTQLRLKIKTAHARPEVKKKVGAASTAAHERRRIERAATDSNYIHGIHHLPERKKPWLAIIATEAGRKTFCRSCDTREEAIAALELLKADPKAFKYRALPIGIWYQEMRNRYRISVRVSGRRTSRYAYTEEDAITLLEKFKEQCETAPHNVPVYNPRAPKQTGRNNITGHVGVYKQPNGKWTAGLGVDGKMVYIRGLATEEEAIAAREELERKRNAGVTIVTKIRKNSTGYRGVYKWGAQFRAGIYYKGTTIYSELVDTKEEAIELRRQLELEYPPIRKYK